MIIKPISLKEANNFITNYHRHHKAVKGYKFAESLWKDNKLVGVAIVGRPLSRYLDNGETMEVTRLCTDGTKNACSMLYSACARICKEMGYNKIITYILETENGSSLKASGWILEQENVGGGTWDSKSRPRELIQYTLFDETIKYPICKKKRYTKKLNL